MAVKTNGIILASRYKYFIDTTGGTSLTDLTDAKFARLGAGFTGTTFSGNETTINNTYLDDEGFGSTDVVGKRFSFAFTGVKMANDPAQEYVIGLQNKLGTDLETRFLVVDPDGNQMIGVAAISALVPNGGNANAGATLTFTVNIQGKLFHLTNPIPVTADAEDDTISPKIDGIKLDATASTNSAATGGTTPSSSAAVPKTH
ncbi:phage tail tube protein [Limosilactobacillus fermentum]|uniref:phage tail tube protein n=1 Tax=Limosilactobacillus fermentum TaxID=1613 RepID=UPI003EBBB740